MTAPARRPLVRRVADAPNVPCPCGISTRVLTGVDDLPCSLHVTFITDSVRHYHKQTTEVYYILEGSGKMELDDETVPVEPGIVVSIPAGVRHRLSSPNGVRTIVIAVPPFRADDEYVDTPAEEPLYRSLQPDVSP